MLSEYIKVGPYIDSLGVLILVVVEYALWAINNITFNI